MERVSEITKVDYMLEKTDPPNLIVTATGNVPSSGWSNPILIRREYMHPPEDGIWEYDMYATAPSNPSADVITQIGPVSNIWKNYDAVNLKGVRVYSEKNTIEVRFMLSKITLRTAQDSLSSSADPSKNSVTLCLQQGSGMFNLALDSDNKGIMMVSGNVQGTVPLGQGGIVGLRDNDGSPSVVSDDSKAPTAGYNPGMF